MDNGKLNFRDIPVDRDLYEIKESSLARKSYKNIAVKNPRLWEYGQRTKPGFTKYLEEVIPVDYHQDSDEYTNTLDFNKRGVDPSFTFDDIKNAQDEALIAKEEAEDLDAYEEVTHIVQDALADYIDAHYDTVKEQLRNSKLDVESLSVGFFNRICSSVASDILMNRDIAEHIEDLYEPGYFDDVFSQYISDAVSIKEKDSPKPLNTLEEATVRTSLNDVVGYIVVEEPEWGDSGNGRNKQGKLEGPFLAVDDSDVSKYDTQYKLVKDIDDAELFKSTEDASEALYYYIYIQGLTEDAEGYTNFYYDELVPFYKKRYHKEPKDSDYKACVGAYISSNYKISEVFYSDLMTAPSTLKESRIGDVEILLEEFDKQYPEGNPKRDEYTLTQHLMRCLNLDKECAFKIANQYLEKGYFTH